MFCFNLKSFHRSLEIYFLLHSSITKEKPNIFHRMIGEIKFRSFKMPSKKLRENGKKCLDWKGVQ